MSMTNAGKIKITIEIDGKEAKSALLREILEQDTLEKAAMKIVEFQALIEEVRARKEREAIERHFALLERQAEALDREEALARQADGASENRSVANDKPRDTN